MKIQHAFVVAFVALMVGAVGCGVDATDQSGDATAAAADVNSEEAMRACFETTVTTCCATAADGGCGGYCTYNYTCCVDAGNPLPCYES